MLNKRLTAVIRNDKKYVAFAPRHGNQPHFDTQYGPLICSPFGYQLGEPGKSQLMSAT